MSIARCGDSSRTTSNTGCGWRARRRRRAAQRTRSPPSTRCATLRRRRRMQDPRIDLAESQADSSLGDFPARARRDSSGRCTSRRTPAPSSWSLAAGCSRAAAISTRASRMPRSSRSKPPGSCSSMRAIKSGAASALNSLASACSPTSRTFTRSQRMYEQSLATSEEIGDRRGMSSALNNLGILLKDQGSWSRRGGPRTLAGAQNEIGDRNWTAMSLSNIGVVLFEAGPPPRSHRLLQGVAGDLPRDRRQARAGPRAAQSGDRRAGNGAARRARASFEESLPARRTSATRADRRWGASSWGSCCCARRDRAARASPSKTRYGSPARRD